MDRIPSPPSLTAPDVMVRHRRRRKWIIVGCVTLLLYVLSYVLLSALGGYQPDVSGRTRFAGGIGLTDAYFWQPYGVYSKPYVDFTGKTRLVASPLGYFYAPMVAADRAWVHKNQFLME